jgi:hypothetical protein
MPRKSSKTTNNTDKEDRHVHIKPLDFDIKNLSFKPLPIDKKRAQQMNYPKYNYDNSGNGQPLLVVTDDIVINRGGIPLHNPIWHSDDPDSHKRAHCHIPYDETNKNSVALFKFLGEIDDYMEKEINENKNSKCILGRVNGKGQVVPYKGLTYKPMITTAKGPQTYDDDDDDESADNNKQFVPYKRIKVKFSTLYDPNLGPNENKTINTRVYVGANSEPEVVKTVTDVEKYLTWRCTALFALMLNKVWIQTSDNKHCGITIKCVQMCITAQPELKQKSSSMLLNKSLFASRQSTITEKESSNKKTNDTSDDNSDSDSDSDNDDDDDDDSDTTDSDDDSNDESDDNTQVRVKSKSSKTVKSAKNKV